MPQFSLSLGRWFGVEVRAHFALVLLLALSVGFAVVENGSPARGLALWLVLLAAILAREIARALAASFFGLSVRGLFLTPVGGVLALAPRRGGMGPQHTRTLSAIGSAANVLAALLLLGFAYGVDPAVHLFAQPWITTSHILRSAVWLQALVGFVNLLPTTGLAPKRPSPAEPAESAKNNAARGGPLSLRTPFTRGILSLFTALALALMLSGIIFGLLWPVLVGMTVLFTSYLTRAVDAGSAESLSVNVRDVMLTEYKPLNASGTLRDALRQATHTGQEVFPVLRGERLVGWINRSALVLRLRAEGDGFLQGAMVRTFQTVSPGERIGDALRRATSMGAGEFIPVVDGDAMVGLLTPVALERAVGQLRLTHVPAPERETP